MFNVWNHYFPNWFRYYILAQFISTECSLHMVFSLTNLIAAITFINSLVMKLTQLCDIFVFYSNDPTARLSRNSSISILGIRELMV